MLLQTQALSKSVPVQEEVAVGGTKKGKGKWQRGNIDWRAFD